MSANTEAVQPVVALPSGMYHITTPSFPVPHPKYNIAKFFSKGSEKTIEHEHHMNIQRQDVFKKASSTSIATDISKGKRRVKKKDATWQVYPETRTTRRREEAEPWVVEHLDTKEKWVGQLNGQNDNECYAVLVRKGDGFEFAPLNRFYDFRPFNQIVGDRPTEKAPIKMHFKLPGAREVEIGASSPESGCKTLFEEDMSDLGVAGDIDEVDFEEEPSDDEDGYRHDGLADDEVEKDAKERMKRDALRDTEGGAGRRGSHHELDSEQRKAILHTFRVATKHLNPEAEIDDEDDDDDDVYRLKYGQPRSEDTEDAIPSDEPLRDVASTFSSSKATKKGRGISRPFSPTPVPSLSQSTAHSAHSLAHLASSSSSKSSGRLPATSPKHRSSVGLGAGAQPRKDLKRKDAPVNGDADPIITGTFPFAAKPTSTKRKRMDKGPSPPCPTVDDLLNLLRADGGEMATDAIRKHYQTNKNIDSREVVNRFLKDSRFVTTSKPSARNIWVHLKPEFMQH
ncbi:hypothetical protein FRB90_011461 [Tulasnella sp. 427]|nr:hypothetical protein FRB90_011461 [Tulasnella sp. 427]